MLWKEGGCKPEWPSTAAGLHRTPQWKTTLFILLWWLIPGLAALWTLFLVQLGDQLSLPVLPPSAEQLEKEKKKEWGNKQHNGVTQPINGVIITNWTVSTHQSPFILLTVNPFSVHVVCLSQKVTQSNPFSALQVKRSHVAYPFTSTVFSINRCYRCKSFLYTKNSVTVNLSIYYAAMQFFWNILSYIVVEHI